MPIFADNRPLLDAFRRGERGALETVYREFFDGIVAIAKHGFTIDSNRLPGLSSVDDQLDLAQEVFMKAFAERARQSYDGLRPYGPFVRRIAKNAMIDRARKAGREVPTQIDDRTLADFDHHPPTREEDLHFKRLRAETEVYLAGQPDDVKRFVRLRFDEGLSQVEVAKKMAITRRRVRTLEGTAMTGLAKHLKKQGMSW